MNNILIIIPSLEPNNKLIDIVNELHDSGFNKIVVVDDGSGPKYQHIFNSIKHDTIYHHNTNLGKGSAIKTAIKEYNSNDIIGYLTCDSDGQHCVNDIIKVSQALINNQNDIILGTRNFKEKSVPFRSKFGNGFSSLFYKMKTGSHCPDTQTGLRAFSIKYKDFALSVPGNRFDYEMNFLMNANKEKINLKYININTIYEENNHSSHFNAIKDSYLVYKEPLKYTIASLSSALIDLLLFTIIMMFFKREALYISIATISARVISGFFNFMLNKKWSFNSNGNIKKEGYKYLLLFVFIMILSSIIVSILSIINLNITIIKMFVDLCLFILTYIVQSRYIFVGDKK